MCPAQYTGTSCLIPVITIAPPTPGTTAAPVVPLPCTSSPCGVGKFCQDVGTSNFTCACPNGFTGSRCEIKVKACDSSPCRGGMCTEDFLNGGGFVCNCPLGTTGKFHSL